MARVLGAEQLGEAARILADGGLVAFPTETVYGLGADATNPEAVARIFAAKGRPSTNPLIVHIDSAASAPRWAAEWPESARRLGEVFWPGPITLVVPASDGIAPSVLAGGSTVGLRVPAHPIALALLSLVRLPIAAPSANRSNRLSPTRAEHVLEELADSVDAVVDGGPCHVGIESTVCELSTKGFRILRPGAITADQIAKVSGLPQMAGGGEGDVLRSPGLFPRHYAPRVPLRLVELGAGSKPPAGVVLLQLADGKAGAFPRLPAEPEGFARSLYEALRRAEATEGVTEIWLESPPQTAEWDAIWDRLRRAATGSGSCPLEP